MPLLSILSSMKWKKNANLCSQVPYVRQSCIVRDSHVCDIITLATVQCAFMRNMDARASMVVVQWLLWIDISPGKTNLCVQLVGGKGSRFVTYVLLSLAVTTEVVAEATACEYSPLKQQWGQAISTYDSVSSFAQAPTTRSVPPSYLFAVPSSILSLVSTNSFV